jgi:predicted nucleic acid-binding protein
MRSPVLYLDTSVIGGYFDTEWQEATRELWRQANLGIFRFVTSAVTVREIAGAPERVREIFEETFDEPEMVMDVTDEIEELAGEYLHQSVVSEKFSDDALHVAACVVGRADFLVTWNFKHLANVSREAAFNAVNLLLGYPSLRIVSPLELIYGREKERL